MGGCEIQQQLRISNSRIKAYEIPEKYVFSGIFLKKTELDKIFSWIIKKIDIYFVFRYVFEILNSEEE